MMRRYVIQSADTATDYSWKNAHGAHVHTTIAALKEQKPSEYEEITNAGYLSVFELGERLKECFSDEESMSLSLIKEEGSFHLCVGGHQTGTQDKIGRNLRFYLVIGSLIELDARKLLICFLSDWNGCLNQIKNTLQLTAPWSFDEVRLDRIIGKWLDSFDLTSTSPVFPKRCLRFRTSIEKGLPQLMEEIKHNCFSTDDGIKLVVANYSPNSRVSIKIKEEADRYLRKGEEDRDEELEDPCEKPSFADIWEKRLKKGTQEGLDFIKEVKKSLVCFLLIFVMGLLLGWMAGGGYALFEDTKPASPSLVDSFGESTYDEGKTVKVSELASPSLVSYFTDSTDGAGKTVKVLNLLSKKIFLRERVAIGVDYQEIEGKGNWVKDVWMLPPLSPYLLYEETFKDDSNLKFLLTAFGDEREQLITRIMQYYYAGGITTELHDKFISFYAKKGIKVGIKDAK